MRSTLALILTGLIASALGLGSAWLALERGIQFDRISLGAWNAWPLAGEPTADPYSKALLARRGSVWMSTTEGLLLRTASDDTGTPLRSSCRYRIEGKIPRGRIWTLASDTIQRRPEFNRFLTSQDVIWNEDESITIDISRTARPGNWLMVSAPETFQLTLRIYDTPLTSGALDETLATPSLKREACQ